MKKRIFSLLLVLCMALSLMMVNVSAAEADDETPADEIEYVATVYSTDDAGTATTTSYATVREALAAAYSGDKVVLLKSCDLTANATVRAGVTFVIPTAADADDTVTGNNISSKVLANEAYVTLRIPENVKLTVRGILLVAGNQQSSQPNSGCLTGDYGAINVEENGNITVNSGAKLYARGKIIGDGQVYALNGATVYQLFQIKDWRGGTKALAAYNASIFPFNLYEVSNIETQIEYAYGSALIGQYYIYASSNDNTGEVPLIGANSQLTFTDETATASITMQKNDDGSFTATIKGHIKTDHIAVSLKQFGFDFAITSSYSVCPFGYNTDVVIANGGKMEITNNLKVLPGCEITVKNGGELIVDAGKSVNFYGANGYSDTYNFASWTSTDAAKLTVENGGTLTNNGTITSTDATFANVTGYTAAQNEDGTSATVVVKEYVQASGAADVTFTVGTPAASSVEE